MRKSTKSSARKNSSRAPRPKKETTRKLKSPEYEEYLERHELLGEGRPRLSPAEFDKLDDELLDLLDLDPDALNDDQLVRIQELEYLLIDSDG